MPNVNTITETDKGPANKGPADKAPTTETADKGPALAMPKPTIGKTVNAKQFAYVAQQYAAANKTIDALTDVDEAEYDSIVSMAKKLARLATENPAAAKLAKAIAKDDEPDATIALALSALANLEQLAKHGSGYTPPNNAFGGLNASNIALSILGRGVTKADARKAFAKHGPQLS